MAFTSPWDFLGVTVSGDLDGITFYTDKHNQKVAFPKDFPKKKPSVLQTAQRESFRLAQASWKNLTTDQQVNLEQSTQSVSAPLTGQNLWISAVMRRDNSDLITFEKQSGIPLPRVVL